MPAKAGFTQGSGTLVPALRFDGFTGSWEQRKLGDICIVSSGMMGDSLLTEGRYHLTRIETIADGVVDETKIGYTNQQPDGSYLLNAGDILYSNINSIAHMGKVAKYQGNSVLYHGINLLRLRPSSDFDSDFLLYLLNTESRRNWAKSHANQAVSQASINQSLLESQEVIICKKEEQQQIGTFFRHLDHLITLVGCECEKLEQVKAAMLEQMFPQDGESEPRLRFDGFTGSWEQRKLGEVGKAQSGVGFPDAEQGGTVGTPFFKVSDMNLDGNENEMCHANNYVSETQISVHRWSPVSALPAIFFAKVGAAVMLNRKRLCRFPFLLDNNTMAYSLSGSEWDADFAKALFETVDLTSLVQVGALPSYNAGDVEAMEIYLPSVDEQRAIGSFFRHLDHLITLYKKKCEKLKQIKQSLLAQMFV